ncbi:MAG: hypothetical protein WAN51_03380 [Alphaproteobacteria bacterium]
MTTFYFSQAFEVDTERHYRHLRIRRYRYKKNFWKQNEASRFKNEIGCYLFGIKHGKKITLTYVGMTTNRFDQEIFQQHKINDHYDRALKKRRNGRAVIIFLTHHYVTKPNLTAIDTLETELIRNAVKRRAKITNLQKTLVRDLRISGVYNFGTGGGPRGRSREAAILLREMLKL